jgi:hypothetical protein
LREEDSSFLTLVSRFQKIIIIDDLGSRVRFSAGTGNYSLLYRVQNGSGAHPHSYPMENSSSFPGGKAAGA